VLLARLFRRSSLKGSEHALTLQGSFDEPCLFMNDTHYQVTLRIPKPHRGWLRFRIRTMLAAIAAVCVVLAFDEHLVLPWTQSAARRERLRQLGDFEQMRQLNLSQVVAMLGPPLHKESPGQGFADVYTWQGSFGVPPLRSAYKLNACCGSDGEICAGVLSVNGKPYRP
jgi:hypothetical protein